MCRVEYVLFAGEALPNGVGVGIAFNIRLATLVGSTETAYPPMKLCEIADWDYIHYSSFFSSDFRPVHVNDLYGPFIVR